MHLKYHVALLYFIILSALFLHPAENILISAGPAGNSSLVFTTPLYSGESATEMLSSLARTFETEIPPRKTAVIFTANDRLTLPLTDHINFPAGTYQVIDTITEQGSGAVIIVLSRSAPGVRIVCGANGHTSPKWLVEAVLSSLKKTTVSWSLAEKRLQLYRLGWTENNPLLFTYLENGIPAILLEAGPDALPVLLQLVATVPDPFPQDWDHHFLIFQSSDKIFLAGEEFSVFVVIFSCAIILLFLFVFSFLFGKKSEQHLRDFLRVWWLPFSYLVVTVLCLLFSGKIIEWLFTFRFGSSASWKLLPQIAFAGKIFISWFLVTLVISFNQLIHFPKNAFIYGYIASLVCLINLLVFSSLDFSLSILFLSVYLLSFALYHLEHPVFHIPGLLLLLLPFLPYIQALLKADGNTLEPLVSGNLWWNLRLALFAMPFQLFLSRFWVRLGRFGRTVKFYIPINLIASFAVFILCVAFIIFFPAWSVDRPLKVSVRQITTDTGTIIKTSSLAADVEIPPLPRAEITMETLSGRKASDYLQVIRTERTYLERTLVNITIRPAVPVLKYELTVSRPRGFSVYDASRPFERLEAGQITFFESEETSGADWSVEFSTDRDADLSIEARLLTRFNPDGLSIRARDIVSDYVLDVSTGIVQESP